VQRKLRDYPCDIAVRAEPFAARRVSFMISLAGSGSSGFGLSAAQRPTPTTVYQSRFSLFSFSFLTDTCRAAGALFFWLRGSGSRSLLSAVQRPTPCYSAAAGAGQSPAKEVNAIGPASLPKRNHTKHQKRRSRVGAAGPAEVATGSRGAGRGLRRAAGGAPATVRACLVPGSWNFGLL